MKDKTRYMGAATVVLTETIWAQVRYLSSQSRADRSDPGSQMAKRKVGHYIHGQSVLLLWGMIYKERGLLAIGLKDI